MEQDDYTKFDLNKVPAELREHAQKYLDADDIEGVLYTLPSHERLDFVAWNQDALILRGMLEKAFVSAYVSDDMSMFSIYDAIELILESCDREYMRETLYPPPVKKKRYKLYRGVVNIEEAMGNYYGGYSWTSSYAVAHNFALRRANLLKMNDPAVLVSFVRHENIIFYSNDRKENEYFVDVTCLGRVKIHSLLDVSAKCIVEP